MYFKHGNMKQCRWETSSPVGQNRVSLISPEIRYLPQDSSMVTPNKEFIVLAECQSCVHIYLYKESSSLLGTKWSFIHCNTLILTYFLFFPSQNKDPLCKQRSRVQAWSNSVGFGDAWPQRGPQLHSLHRSKPHRFRLQRPPGVDKRWHTAYQPHLLWKCKRLVVYDAIQCQILNTGSVSVFKILKWKHV